MQGRGAPSSQDQMEERGWRSYQAGGRWEAWVYLQQELFTLWCISSGSTNFKQFSLSPKISRSGRRRIVVATLAPLYIMPSKDAMVSIKTFETWVFFRLNRWLWDWTNICRFNRWDGVRPNCISSGQTKDPTNTLLFMLVQRCKMSQTHRYDRYICERHCIGRLG